MGNSGIGVPLPELAAYCREAAAEGAVLLKNEGHMLPVKKDETVSIFGRSQIEYYRSGTGSGGAVNVPYVKNILDGITFQIDQGQRVGLLGKNGAGKSTLFSAIGGSFWADSGAIFLDGKNITYDPEHKRAAKIGRLFQDPMKGTAPHMTIEENLALSYSRSQRRGLRLAVCRRDRDFFRSALAEFDMGLEDRMDTKVGLLSGGQRQALTLLMSTIVPPKLLLLDEPTSALDVRHQLVVMETVHRYCKKRNAIALYVIHDLMLASRFSDAVLFLHNGVAHAFDTPEAVLNSATIDPIYQIESLIEKNSRGLTTMTPIKPL